ncbi:MAG: tetratricopeptide repeat protein [Cyanobacteriota bacterium]|nr:tetratricopeptide repeat protein [Cyanobacteriota bacterium]
MSGLEIAKNKYYNVWHNYRSEDWFKEAEEEFDVAAALALPTHIRINNIRQFFSVRMQIYGWVVMGNEGMSAGQLLKQANQLKRVGRLDEAIALYHQVIEINPNFAWAYHNLGNAFVKQGHLDE